MTTKLETDLFVFQQDVEAWIENVLQPRCGYTTAELDSIKYLAGQLKVVLTLRDDFQEELDYHGMTLNHGYSMSYNWPVNLEEEKFESREMRELRVLLRKNGESLGLKSKLESAAAKLFVEDLQRETDKYRLLVAPNPAPETPSDEVLF